MRWPPYKHIFFDCDSTLTQVEGIDVLAEMVGKKWRVEVLTRAAMDGDLDLSVVYAKRLKAVQPTRSQIHDIRQVYKRQAVADAASVIAALAHLGHNVYIISGGLAEPVVEFGIYLGVPRDRIRAVAVEYNELSDDWWQHYADSSGRARYLDYDEGALTVSTGKAQVVRELLGDQAGRTMLVGDGISDLLASHAVDLFIGFGGVVSRPRVKEEAPAFVHSRSLAPVLALAAGPAALRLLNHTPYQAVGQTAHDLVAQGAVTFQNERLSQKFTEAYQAIHSWPDRGAA